jgi:hypothetical protein
MSRLRLGCLSRSKRGRQRRAARELGATAIRNEGWLPYAAGSDATETRILQKKTKFIQGNQRKLPLISFRFLCRIGTFQRVTSKKIKKIFSSQARVSGCARSDIGRTNLLSGAHPSGSQGKVSSGDIIATNSGFSKKMYARWFFLKFIPGAYSASCCMADRRDKPSFPSWPDLTRPSTPAAAKARLSFR